MRSIRELRLWSYFLFTPVEILSAWFEALLLFSGSSVRGDERGGRVLRVRGYWINVMSHAQLFIEIWQL